MDLFKIQLFCCSVENCSKEYTSKFNLKKHVSIVHLNKHNFQCDLCGKKFVSRQNLREHKFIHSGIKPLKCSFCGKKFRQSSQLCMHKCKHKKTYLETLKFVIEFDEKTK